MMPLILANHVRLLLKNRPRAENPSPRIKKAQLMPTTKNKVLTSTFFLG